MQEPIRPADEAERQGALHDLLLLDTSPEERFDRITRTVRRLFGAQTALVTLVDAERQWFKSRQGLDAAQTPRDISFCGHTILGDDIFVVENALEDPRFADNPLVTGAPFIRFYAGVPLRAAGGYKVGTLCILDPQPRSFGADDRATLRDLAAWAEGELNNVELHEASAQAQSSERAMAELNHQLRVKTDFQRAILNSANFSIISTDVDGVIQLFNIGAERMLGYRAADVVERKTLAILHDLNEVKVRATELSIELGVTVEPNFEALVAKARSSTADEHEWTYTRKDSSRFRVMLSMTALRNEQQELTGFLAIAYDITERNQVESMKSEFISTVSHELRTPLTSIRGSLGLLSAGMVGVIPERARSLLDIAKNNCERLVRLINDILDVEKIESGNMPFDMRTQQLRPLVEQAIAATQSFAAGHNVRIALVSDEADGLVTIDTDRITQVVINLLSNAAKFSPAGGVVEVRIEPRPPGVRLVVADKGRGIPAEFRTRIFQKFSQGDSSDTRQKGGTGLGLSISRAIIDKHHGRIDFTSKIGLGSEFFFDLPLAAALPAKPPQAGRYLVCEDDPVVARTLDLTLKKMGLQVDLADSAEAARRLLLAQSYDGMTLDLMLPGEDGASLLDWLRSEEKTRRLPVVIVSATGEPQTGEFGGVALGVVDWLAKPVDPARLMEAVRHGARQVIGESPTVLYVEDDLDLARVVRATLEPAMTITHVINLGDARAALTRYRYGLILLDLQLPDGNASSLLAELPPLNASTPVVIFSAQESTHLSLANVHATLVKSRTSHEELLLTLQNLVSETRASQLTKDLT